MRTSRQSACLAISLSLVLTVALSACNLFDPLDSPSGDEQLKSAARACLDNGDYACARENFQKLSGSSSDIMQSELAFTDIDEAGAGIGPFITGFGNGKGSAGAAVSKMGGYMSSKTVNSDTRKAIYRAYLRNTSITNTELKGFVRFVGAMGIMAAVLAEQAANPGTVRKADLANNPTTCMAAAQAACGVTAGCAKPTGKTTISNTGGGTPITFSSAGEAVIGMATPTYELINSTIAEINAALTQMGVTGGSTSAFSQSFGSTALGVNEYCFIWTLLNQGMGE